MAHSLCWPKALACPDSYREKGHRFDSCNLHQSHEFSGLFLLLVSKTCLSLPLQYVEKLFKSARQPLLRPVGETATFVKTF